MASRDSELFDPYSWLALLVFTFVVAVFTGGLPWYSIISFGWIAWVILVMAGD